MKNTDVFSFNQIRALRAKQDELGNVVGQFHRFIARYAEHEFTKKANVVITTHFDISVLDVSSGCFPLIPLIDDNALAKCPYGLAACVCSCVGCVTRQLQWAHNHAHTDSSMAELLVNFIFSVHMRPPINKFTNKKKRPSYMLRLPGTYVTNYRSLYILGYSRPTRGVAYRVKHLCVPAPRAHLQQIFL